jgi:biotin carboxyl carrier protein
LLFLSCPNNAVNLILMVYDVTIDGKDYRLELAQAEGSWQCRLDDRELRIDAVLPQRDVLSVLIEGKSYEVKREHTATGTFLWIGDLRYVTELRDPRSLRGCKRRGAGSEDGPQKLVAPMPGKVVRVLIPENTEVQVGQGIMVVEAMKMQNEIKSPKSGIVEKIVAEGTNVNAGDVLAIVN